MEINFDVFDKKCSGVYMIKNVLNNHKYIGSTKNFKQRLNNTLLLVALFLCVLEE